MHSDRAAITARVVASLCALPHKQVVAWLASTYNTRDRCEHDRFEIRVQSDLYSLYVFVLLMGRFVSQAQTGRTYAPGTGAVAPPATSKQAFTPHEHD